MKDLGSRYLPANQWKTLGEGFSDEVSPAHFPKTTLRYRNLSASQEIGIESITDEEWIDFFARFNPLPHNIPKPLALRYHGHQFMHYNPDLGDGRGFLFAQVYDDKKRLLDLGTKGSGQTPYSRQGDGRLTLKGGVREVLATERLFALGVNTSRTLSLVETGESLIRNDEPSPTRSSVLVRLSHSHLRIGMFQRLAFLNLKEDMTKLLKYTYENFYPEAQINSGDPLVNLFNLIGQSAAKTCAEWMIHGFVHGVLNTDNINITGESFDYGPYRFLPHYDPHFTAAYFDREGLYAFGKQPRMVLWALEQLAGVFEWYQPQSKFDSGLELFAETFEKSTYSLFLKKLNLKHPKKLTDLKLFNVTFDFLFKSKMPYDEFFFDAFGGIESLKKNKQRRSQYSGTEYDQLIHELSQFSCENEKLLNHSYFKNETPCHLRIDEIEKIWDSIDKFDDWTLFEQKIKQTQQAVFHS